MAAMSIREQWIAWGKLPAVRTGLFILGWVLLLLTPVVGALPGPGGVIVFGAGATLVLKYSDWAKRKYVEFKRKHPNKGRWADWSLRRQSAKRREELRKQQEAPNTALDD
jgi:Putative transmembrane protein (PGPGW)